MSSCPRMDHDGDQFLLNILYLQGIFHQLLTNSYLIEYRSLFTRVNVGGKIFPLANNGWIYNGTQAVRFSI